MSDLVLELFPGIGLLGRGFEDEGFSVVRGPDLLWGGDIRRFHLPRGRFDGVIGGSPCQDFSKGRRSPETGQGLALLREFLRVVVEAGPAWFLLENVPGVPSVGVEGYVVQRFDICAWEFRLPQCRRRHFQFGSVTGRSLVVPRLETVPGVLEPAVTASEVRRSGCRDWTAFLALMGVTDLVLPGFTREAAFRAVGNGVPVPVARAIAAAIRDPAAFIRDCAGGELFPRSCSCGCGRLVTGRRVTALAACRKRLQRARSGVVTVRGTVTALAA